MKSLTRMIFALALVPLLGGCISLPSFGGGSSIDQERLARAMELNPSNPHALYMTGNALLQEDEPGKAAKYFQLAIEAKQDFAEAHAGLGLAYLEQNKLKKARAAFENLQQIRPGSPAAFEGIATVALLEGNLTEAEQGAQAALNANANSAQAHRLLGEVAYIRTAYQDALDHWERAVELNPGLASSLSPMIADLQAYVNRYAPATPQYHRNP